MEGILIPAIIYVLGVAFKVFFKEDEDDDKNTESKSPLLKTVKSRVKDMNINLNELSYKQKKQKHIVGSKEKYLDEEPKKNVDEGISAIFTEDIEGKQDPANLYYNIDQEETLDRDHEKSINSDEGFDLFSDSNDLMKAIVMSEILKKPKSMQR